VLGPLDFPELQLLGSVLADTVLELLVFGFLNDGSEVRDDGVFGPIFREPGGVD
jgi:hypothetical protein